MKIWLGQRGWGWRLWGVTWGNRWFLGFSWRSEMTKREKAKEQKRQQELAALKCELRLIAYGANGGCDVDGDDQSLFGLMSPEGFGNYLAAIRRIWGYAEGRRPCLDDRSPPSI